MISLRSYQEEQCKAALSSTKNVLIQSDTGSGKSRTLAAVADLSENTIIIAHRNILIKQLSLELAKFKILHSCICSKYTLRSCLLEHRKIGDECIGESNTFVASIQSLVSRHKRKILGLDTESDWTILIDEAHHIIEDNIWGKLLTIFPNSRVIGFTATPCRGDNTSLERGKGGVFDEIFQASELKKDSVRTLIKWGYLSDFKCFAAREVLNKSGLILGIHDYTNQSLCKETNKVKIKMAGDAVKQWNKNAQGLQTIGFCVSIEIAKDTARIFREAGVESACIHSEMSRNEIDRVIYLFLNKYIKVVFHVDMLGEGVDFPGIECVMMLRKTASIGAYRQWCGRGMRVFSGKKEVVFLDFVGNIRSHGLPDKDIKWSLRTPPSSKSNLTVCVDCDFIISVFDRVCKNCGSVQETRSGTELQKECEYIDVNFVLLERQKIQKEWRGSNVLEIRSHHSSGSQIQKTIHSIKLMFADCLEDKIGIKDLNYFFNCVDVQKQEFWIRNFSISDLSNKSTAKCEKVYIKWQRSK